MITTSTPYTLASDHNTSTLLLAHTLRLPCFY